MRAVLQRVRQASVQVRDEVIGAIGPGTLVFLGVAADDDETDVASLVDKVIELRFFEDEQGKMNRSIREIGGSLLVVSQFTLLGDCRKGRRPSFDRAAPLELAERLYLRWIELAAAQGIPVATGRFRADMQISLVNDGPVTLLLDSRKLF